MRDNVALSWNTAALEAVRRTRMGPPIVARALHVLHAAMYDAWAAPDEVAFGSRLGDRVRRPPADRTEAARREAASFAAHRALVDLFPSEAAGFARLLVGLGHHPDAVGPEGSPSAVGVLAARAVLAFRHGDGANQLGDLGRGPGQLAEPYAGLDRLPAGQRADAAARPQPLAAAAHPDGAGQRLLVPHWGLVAPFALAAGWELRPRGPRRHPGPGFLAQAAELLADSAGLTDEHKAIAEHWADGPIPRPRPATGACSPRRCRPGTATAWTRTCGCSSPSPGRCWTPASPAGTPSGPTTRSGRSRPSGSCSPARRCRPGAARGRGRAASGARRGSPTSPPRRSPSIPRGIPPSAPPGPRCWPPSPAPTASGRA